MIKEFVGHREKYNTIPVSVVDYFYEYEGCPTAAKLRPPLSPDPSIHSIFSAHTHDSLEILLVRSGAMDIELNKESLPLKAGDIVIINPFDIHGGQIHPEDRYVSYACLMLELRSYMLDFKGNHLDRMLSQILDGRLRFDSVLKAELPEVSRISNLIEQLKGSFESAQNEHSAALECQMMSLIYSLLSELSALTHETSSSFAKGHDIMFIRSVDEYICENYASHITIESICSALGFGERNFYRLFRQSFGTTFINYLREYRIQRALRDYSASNIPIAEIASSVGFTDYCYFSRTFRRMTGVSPSEYFKS